MHQKEKVQLQNIYNTHTKKCFICYSSLCPIHKSLYCNATQRESPNTKIDSRKDYSPLCPIHKYYFCLWSVTVISQTQTH